MVEALKNGHEPLQTVNAKYAWKDGQQRGQYRKRISNLKMDMQK
jgi:hypothetical protein